MKKVFIILAILIIGFFSGILMSYFNISVAKLQGGLVTIKFFNNYINYYLED